jgi:hypothetical protein
MMRLKRNTWLNVFVLFLATVGGSVVGFWVVLLTFGPASPFPTLHPMTTETTGAGTTSTDRQSWISR